MGKFQFYDRVVVREAVRVNNGMQIAGLIGQVVQILPNEKHPTLLKYVVRLSVPATYETPKTQADREFYARDLRAYDRATDDKWHHVSMQFAVRVPGDESSKETYEHVQALLQSMPDGYPEGYIVHVSGQTSRVNEPTDG